MKKAKLLWVDLEMTGLDPAKDRICEIAAIATDMELNEIARFEAIVKVDKKLMDERMVGEFWEKNSATRDALIEQKDRKFIEREMPELNKRLHYRMLDVSAWKIYFENALNKKFTKPDNHRALDDINGSIEEFKWYLTFMK